MLKLITRRGPVHLDNDFAVLVATLEHLKFLKPERQRGSQADGNANRPRRMSRFFTWKKRSKSGQSSSTGGEVELEVI